MNIFVLDYDPKTCAKYHADKHVVKMILEHAQMMSTAIRLSGIDAGYKITHKNHPCSIWTRSSLDNFMWLYDLTYFLNEEYKRRYKHTYNHKSFDVIENILMITPEINIPNIGMTEFAQAMPDQYRNIDAVKAYRNYYINEKSHLFSWKDTEQPFWINKGV